MEYYAHHKYTLALKYLVRVDVYLEDGVVHLHLSLLWKTTPEFIKFSII